MGDVSGGYRERLEKRLENKSEKIKISALGAAAFASMLGACKGIWMISDGLLPYDYKIDSPELYGGMAVFGLGSALAVYFANKFNDRLYKLNGVKKG